MIRVERVPARAKIVRDALQAGWRVAGSQRVSQLSAMQWLSSIQDAATSAVTSLQETIENEKKEFMQEYNSTGAAEPASASKAGSSAAAAGASSADDGDTLQHLRRVGWAMLNPLEDQDSLKAEERGPSVVMLPWETPGLSEPVRGAPQPAPSPLGPFG